jgi:competence protein ComEA
MNPVRKWVRDIFGFSGTEINGFLILIPLMALLIFSEPVYHSWMANRQRQYPEDVRKLDSLVAAWQKPAPASNEPPVLQQVALFAFDPNSASIGDLRQLGFTATSANRIAAYRQKGGVFRIKSDLLKIYGLDSALYKQLYTFIKLPSSRLHQDRPLAPTSERFEKKRVKKTFDINTADTILLKTVYGIGSTLAARIIKFRNALGGFVDPEQLEEVYGLDSVVVQRLLTDAFIDPGFVPEKININTADEKTLSGHPYIRKKIARALISYRFQHGDFMEVRDIKNLSIMQPDDVDRLLPYIKIRD